MTTPFIAHHRTETNLSKANFEEAYAMSLKSTYGTNQCSDKETTHELVDGSGNSQKTKFNYPEVVGNHFFY